MKQHYYCVSALILFWRKEGSEVNNSLQIFEIFCIEQSADEPDQTFYANLIQKIGKEVGVRAEEWIKKMNGGRPAGDDYCWIKSSQNVSNISKV